MSNSYYYMKLLSYPVLFKQNERFAAVCSICSFLSSKTKSVMSCIDFDEGVNVFFVMLLEKTFKETKLANITFCGV